MPMKSPPRERPRPGFVADLSGSNVERAGDHNQRAVLQGIRLGGPITKTELTAITGLTPPAIASITKRLHDLELISEYGLRTGGRGQPAMRLTINPDGAMAIGLNVDRDHLSLVVVDLAGRVRVEVQEKVLLPSPKTVSSFFRSTLADLRKAKAVPLDRLVGLGVALPDQFTRAHNARLPEAFDAWNRTDLQALFRDIIDLPLFVENDAAAAAFGEAQLGHGLRSSSFLYILVNFGLGGGLIIDGVPFRGADRRSGEIGLLPAGTSGRTVEHVASLSALFERMEAAGHPIESPRDIGRLSAEGQAVLAAWLEEAADVLAQMLVALNCVLNPDAVYIGGRLPTALCDILAQLITQRLLLTASHLPHVAPVQRAAIAVDAPAIGAALLALSTLLLPSREVFKKALDD